MAHRLDYSHNWNNKLDCPIHTTIRLSGRLQVGYLVAEFFKGEYKGHVKVIDKKRILLDTLNDWVAGLDTGYDAAETIRIIKTMYKAKNIDWEKTPVYYYLLKRVEVQTSITPEQAMILA